MQPYYGGRKERVTYAFLSAVNSEWHTTRINDSMKGNHHRGPLVIASAMHFGLAMTLVPFSSAMERLRVVAECWPPNIYYDSLPNGTEWHGNGMWTLREMRGLLPPIEVVANLSRSEDTFDAIQTLYDGRADMSTDKWGITHERSKLVDFSYALKVYGTYLYRVVQLNFTKKLKNFQCSLFQTLQFTYLCSTLYS